MGEGAQLALVQVRVEGDRQETELRSLHDWLRQEPAARRARVSLLEQPPPPGAMGSLLDVLQLVTGNGWSAASFVVSVMAWRQTRPRPPRTTVRRGGVEVTLAEGTEAEVQRLVALLEADDGQQDRPS